MSTRFFSGVSLLVVSAVGCGSEPPPLAPTQAVSVPAAVAKAAAPLLRIADAQASVESTNAKKADWKQDFRSQGATHVLAGSADRIVIISADHGVEGFIHPPVAGQMRWAGFGKSDAVLVLIGTTLFRAVDSAAAIAGKFDRLPVAIDERFTRIASDKNILVAGAADASAYVESTDGGASLHPSTLASKDPLAQIVVRSDGTVVAAHEVARRPGKYGGTTIHAQVFVKSSTKGSWVKGPLAESSSEPLTLYGDALETIEIKDNQKFEVEHEGIVVALDAKRKWVHASWTSPWLQLWPSETFEPTVIAPRPRMPIPAKDDDDADLLLGALGGHAPSHCAGVDCLANRSARGPAPTVRAWDDAACDATAIVESDEDVTVSSFDGSPEKKQTIHHRDCDAKKSASRSVSLFLPGNDVFTAPRLPRSCPSGRVTGTDAWPIIACATTYGGTAQLLSVDQTGGITPMTDAIHVALKDPASQRAGDGTTILSSVEQLLLCDPKARRCSALARGEKFLAALPVDGGRALVFSRGADEHELAIALTSGTTAPLVRVEVAENVLDASITSDGNLRLWTHPEVQTQMNADGWRREKRTAASLHAWLVRNDGSLDGDPNAVTKFLSSASSEADPK